jgi:hypothetical protein
MGEGWDHMAIARGSLLRRRVLFGAVVLALAACADREEPVAYEPLRYDYLQPIGLNVATLDIEEPWTAPSNGHEVSTLAPTPPAAALRQMALDRIKATGNAGRAVFVIEDASIQEIGSRYDGALSVRLDIFAADNTPAGSVVARVTRSRGPASDDRAEESAALYELTRQMMADMNVELEYQIRRGLRAWLQSAPTPTPVEQQALPPPPASL